MYHFTEEMVLSYFVAARFSLSLIATPILVKGIGATAIGYKFFTIFLLHAHDFA
jgi:hypothetical protein